MSLTNLDRNSFFLFAIQVMIIGIDFDLFTRLTKIPTFWPSVLVVLFITIYTNSVVLALRSVLLTLLLLININVYSIFDHFNGVPETVTNLFGLFTIVYPYLLVAIIIENLLILKVNDNALTYQIGRFGLGVIIIALTISVISEIMFVGIMRSDFAKLFNLPFWAWSVSFGTFNSMPFILMAIIMFYKGNKYMMYIIISMFIFTIIKSGFMIALVITGVGLLIAFLYRFNIKSFYLNIILLLLIFVLSFSNINNIVSFLPKLPNKIYTEKATDISKIQENNNYLDILAATRQGVYEKSVNTFAKHPVFGSGYFWDSGGHSYILDRLSFVGIFGTFFYLIVLFTLFKRSCLLIEKSQKKAYVYIMGTIFLFLLFNPIEWPNFWLSVFVILPSIIVYLSKVENRKLILSTK